MIEKEKVLAIIPARGGSKRIPRKNLKAISGKPMLLYTIEAAKECKYIDKVVVSTDDEEIASISMKAQAIVPFRRPEELSTDDAGLLGVVLHAIDFYAQKGERYDIVVVLPPSSPLRTEEDIRRALEYFMKKEEQSLVSLSEVCDHPEDMRQFKEDATLERMLDPENLKKGRANNRFYKINRAIYINRAMELDENTNLDDNVLGFVLKKEHGLDIREPEDVVVADYYLSQDCNAEYLSFIVY